VKKHSIGRLGILKTPRGGPHRQKKRMFNEYEFDVITDYGSDEAESYPPHYDEGTNEYDDDDSDD